MCISGRKLSSYLLRRPELNFLRGAPQASHSTRCVGFSILHFEQTILPLDPAPVRYVADTWSEPLSGLAPVTPSPKSTLVIPSGSRLKVKELVSLVPGRGTATCFTRDAPQ